MESMNKFKVLTILIMCVFVFVIAAIYTNTKEVAAKKEKIQQGQAESSQAKEVKEVEYADNEFANVVNDVSNLTQRVDELTSRLNDREASTKTVRCKILGVLSDGSVEELAPDEAVQDAKMSGNSLVVTCKL